MPGTFGRIYNGMVYVQDDSKDCFEQNVLIKTVTGNGQTTPNASFITVLEELSFSHVIGPFFVLCFHKLVKRFLGNFLQFLYSLFLYEYLLFSCCTASDSLPKQLQYLCFLYHYISNSPTYLHARTCVYVRACRSSLALVLH